MKAAVGTATGNRASGAPPANRQGKRIPGWLSGAIVLGAFLTVAVAEARRPLIPQDEITVGVPAFRDPDEVTLPRLVEMPFVEQRPAWLLLDGSKPRRVPASDARSGIPL